MMVYIDSSALLKLYFDESDSDACEELMLSDPDWITARHTTVEVRRNLAKELQDKPAREARDQFLRDWDAITIVELDRQVCETAAQIAEVTGVRALDALHLGAAQRVGRGVIPFLTYDLRQAQAARELGWTVLGA